MTGTIDDEPVREYADDRLIEMADYDGYRVVLTRGQWYAHVLTVKSYMADHLDDVRETVANPAFVNRDSHPGFPYRACYYGRYTTSNPRLMLKVVVDHHRSPGFIVTAYPCSGPPAREVRIWTREST